MDSLTTTIYGDMKTAIAAIAKSLGIATEDVFEVLIRQQVVNSIIYVIVGVFAIILIIATYKIAMRIEDPNTNKEQIFLGFTIVFGFIGIICFVIFMVNFQAMLTGFVNPEYGAIKEIMSWL